MDFNNQVLLCAIAHTNLIPTFSIYFYPICCDFQIDTPMLASEWKKPGMLNHFTVVRKLDGGIFPLGFTKEATERNSKAGSNVISFESRYNFTYCSILCFLQYSSFLRVSIFSSYWVCITFWQWESFVEPFDDWIAQVG